MNHDLPPAQGNKPPEPVLERAPERFATKEEVLTAFEYLLRGRESSVLTEKMDEQGLCVFEIRVPGENPAEHTEYNYQRAKYDTRAEGIPSTTCFTGSIHAVFCEDEMPVGGECVANYRDGVWEYV